MSRILIFVFLLSNIGGSLCGHFVSITEHTEKHTFVEKGPRTSVDDPEVFEKIKPYLLPDNCRAAAVLKQILSKRDVLSSTETLENAGFQLICSRKEKTRLIVVSHPLLKGFLLKVYSEDLRHSEWTRWVRRIKGALCLQAIIDENKRYKKYFKVPKKWIYILPKENRGKGEFARESVLLVEDMQITDKETNRALHRVLWSYAGLDALYTVLQKSGFSDGHIDNLPFSTDHRVAFIDTEYTNQANVHFDWLTKWFADSKQPYWEALMEHGGP